MPATFSIKLRGHPWDLWGLSQIFNGNNSDHTLIVATKPEGRPRVDYQDKAALHRFQRMGYDVYATLTTDSLTFADGEIPFFDDAKDITRGILVRINGVARLIDPDFLPVSLHEISYKAKGGMGAADFGRSPPNKENTFLGVHPAHVALVSNVYALAETNSAVRFVLDALNLPTTWASSYLVYDAIKEDVGGQKSLEAIGWITAQELSDFRYSANSSREIKEGATHGGANILPKPLLRLSHARDIVERLARAWLRSL